MSKLEKIVVFLVVSAVLWFSIDMLVFRAMAIAIWIAVFTGATGAKPNPSPRFVIERLYLNNGGSMPFESLRDCNFDFEYWKTQYPVHANDFIGFGLVPITQETRNYVYLAASNDLNIVENR